MGKIRNRKKWIAKPTRLSEGLRLARTRHKGFTQKSVAEVTGIPRPRISEYETGARIPSQKTLNKLLRYYLDRQLISFAFKATTWFAPAETIGIATESLGRIPKRRIEP